MSSPNTMPEFIYKIASRAVFEASRETGRFGGMPIDLKDGYVHFSTAAQLAETLRLHFAGQGDLVLFSVPTAALGSALVWEPSRGGAAVPASLWRAADVGGDQECRLLRRNGWQRDAAGVGEMIFTRLSPLLRMPLVAGLTRDALLRMDPEIAHGATISALRLGLAPEQEQPDPPELATTLCGLELSNPVGMAAGFDKNAEVPKPLARMGFGMVEVGTVTPRPQQGNPKPRLFRIGPAEGVVNRMGFNNEGHEAAFARLKGAHVGAILGVNIGANKDSEDFVADYVMGVTRFAEVADYLTVNISSPNTPGLRNLQADEALTRLLDAVLKARSKASVRVPVFLKLAPDLDERQLDGIAKVVLATDLDGLIVSNTTISRDPVLGMENATETGGLSGKPLFDLSTRRLAQMRQRVGRLPIIGVGGIHSPQTAVAKFEAGADAIQLYSALVFGGLELLDRIKRGLVAAVRAQGLKSVSELTGRTTGDWAAGKAGL